MWRSLTSAFRASVLAEARQTGLSVDEDGNLMIKKPAA